MPGRHAGITQTNSPSEIPKRVIIDTDMRFIRQKTLGFGALLWLLLTVTVSLQSWVGDQTIYATELESRREALHHAILTNQAPNGRSWAAAGASSLQKRIGVVYLAEAVRKLSGLSIGATYKLLDSAFLFFSLVTLFLFLRKWLPDEYCLIGVLYFCAVLPLTYFFQLFHPWDRLQLLIWILLLHLIVEHKFILLSIGLALSVLIKFDTILIPALYFVVHFHRDAWWRTSSETLFLFFLAFVTNAVLSYLFQDPNEVSRFSLSAMYEMTTNNAQKALHMHVRYPPLLMHALPACLALVGLREKPRFVVASAMFGLVLSGVFVLLTNYEEVRAHIMVLVLFAPSALLTVRKILENTQAHSIVDNKGLTND